MLCTNWGKRIAILGAAILYIQLSVVSGFVVHLDTWIRKIKESQSRCWKKRISIFETVILDLQFPIFWSNVLPYCISLLDPENLGIAVEIALLSSLTTEIYAFPV